MYELYSSPYLGSILSPSGHIARSGDISKVRLGNKARYPTQHAKMQSVVFPPHACIKNYSV